MVLSEENLAGLDVTLALPPHGAVGAPVLLGLHGRGSSPALLLERARVLGERFIHAIPRGPITVDSGQAWYERGDPRPAQLLESRRKLLALVDELRRRFSTGPERMAVWGFSQGGLMSLEVGLRTSSPLAAVVSIGGKLDDESASATEVIARARARSFFLIHGVNDDVIPHAASREAYRALNAHGGRVELAELAMKHEMTPVALGAVRGYLNSIFGQPLPTA